MAVPLRRQDSSPARTARPALTLAGQHRRRRWPAALIAVVTTAVLAGLLGAAVFHTQLAERQLEINRLERSVREERERFDELRYRRAELRSPVRLAAEASQLGMVPGATNQFVEVDAWAVARQLAAAGVVDDDTRYIILDTDPLDQFSDVKRVSSGQP